jgi:hypothetical protein
MGDYIPSNVSDLSSLARFTDDSLVEVEKMTKRGVVHNGILANSRNSYTFEDEDGNLFFYSSKTQTVRSIDLTA